MNIKALIAVAVTVAVGFSPLKYTKIVRILINITGG